jgi:hypothetical protein
MSAAPTMNNWRRIVGQRVARLTPAQARALLDDIRGEGTTIFHPAIRGLTNGLNSQSINSYVMRKLAVQAGMLPKGAA